MQRRYRTRADHQKKWILILFYVVAFSIFFSGVFYSTYSLIYNFKFQIVGRYMPSYIVGLLVAYLGVRYIIKIRTFENEFLKETSVFSWKNLHRKKHSGGAKI